MVVLPSIDRWAASAWTQVDHDISIQSAIIYTDEEVLPDTAKLPAERVKVVCTKIAVESNTQALRPGRVSRCDLVSNRLVR